ncbi:hypothetical protein AXG93_4316s1110 [Marchantia polymorpha subsp. ruderalis]|uniref:Uncharacterized protein n=1 Tax=Marchantia polymorpha subsp. ruderalis TaxID=1480154 RepID=A0A176VRY5_MARPO|nr:hypothetical protein AXG93_4316s1110 [Marchantia polymorpha subsp. ruderalis]
MQGRMSREREILQEIVERIGWVYAGLWQPLPPDNRLEFRAHVGCIVQFLGVDGISSDEGIRFSKPYRGIAAASQLGFEPAYSIESSDRVLNVFVSGYAGNCCG